MAETDRPSKRRKIPTNPRWAMAGGLAVIGVMVVGFGGWAATAPLASAIVAPGVLMVESNRKQVQHDEGGTISRLLVQDGDSVEAGDVLIRLDDVRAKASLAILTLNLDSALALQARLLAERDDRDRPAFPGSLTDRQDDPKVNDIVRGQRSLFEARRSSRAGEIAVLRQRIAQLEEEITGLESQRSAKTRQIALITGELKDLRKLLKRGHVQKSRVLALEREQARLEGERGQLIADKARSKTAIGETRIQIIQITKSFREDVVRELRDVQQEIFDLQERITAARRVLDKIEIRAPATGIIVGRTVHTVGGVVKAGETLMEIVPKSDRLVIETKIQPFDAETLSVGLTADIRLTAFNQRTTPSIEGQVAYVSADSLTNQRSGESYYLARITVDEKQVADLDAGPLQPGMPAEVMIRTGSRTALRYLMQPILDSMQRAWREE